MEDRAVDTIVDLGLTVLQAKAYIALAKSGISTGRVTAKNANVASQDIYRVMNELGDKGLVEKIIAKPTKYRALPIEEGLQLLLKRRQDRTAQLEKASEIISKAARVYPVMSEEIGEFIIIPKREAIDKMAHKMFQTAKTSVDLFNEAQEVLRLHERHFESKAAALKNGVRVRSFLCSKPDDFPLPTAYLNYIKANHLVQVKTINSPPLARLVIKDNREIFLATTLKPNTLTQPFLWTNNSVLVQIIQQWFNGMWLIGNELT